jgi:ferritin-like metal-binding protein YciE
VNELVTILFPRVSAQRQRTNEQDLRSRVEEVMAAMKSLEDLFVDKLKDIHDAEKRITKALPKMIKAASSPELAEAFEEHLQVTEQQIERLEQIFQNLGKTPARKTCHGMMGILEEGGETMEQQAPEAVMDAALISSAQEVEHYEIGAYGCLKAWADLLGRKEDAKLLQETLEEEEETDQKLTQLAKSINSQAMNAGGEEQEEDEEQMATASRRTGNGSMSSSKKSSRR